MFQYLQQSQCTGPTVQQLQEAWARHFITILLSFVVSARKDTPQLLRKAREKVHCCRALQAGKASRHNIN
jgi:hypothetical protein